MKEALDIAYEEENVSQIYIEPPESQVLTDEDSGDEEDGGIADNLSAKQLRAGAEIVLDNSERLGDQSDLANTFDSPVVQNEAVDPGENQIPRAKNAVPITISLPTTFSFIDGDLTSAIQEFPSSDYSKYSEMSCIELFELFFSKDLIETIISQTRKYAIFKNAPDLNITPSEMKVFLSILVLSGYNQLPSKRSYWENNEDMKNLLVSRAMRRDRFLQICRFIHFADNNTIDKDDKMYKLRTLTDALKKAFLDHFVPEQNLAYDESMIRYFGHHGCKQFIRGKPVRFGYKVWSFNTPSGYLINFEIYQGRNPRSNPEYEKAFGKPTAPMIQMIEELGEKRSLRYNFFFDNLFTSKNLLTTLKCNGFGGTGTMRENRISADCPLTSKKAMEKRSRGEYSSTLDRENGILYVRWTDSKVVTVASTCFGIQPIKSVDRFSKQHSRIIQVPRPDLILKYNQSMGGTDQMDNNISW